MAEGIGYKAGERPAGKISSKASKSRKLVPPKSKTPSSPRRTRKTR